MCPQTDKGQETGSRPHQGSDQKSEPEGQMASSNYQIKVDLHGWQDPPDTLHPSKILAQESQP